MAEKEKEKKTVSVRNTLREKPAPEIKEEEQETPASEKKPRKKAEKTEKKEKEPRKGFTNPFKSFVTNIRENERLHKLVGAFLLFIVTPYLAVAFTSYFFTWQADQDKVSGPIGELLLTDIRVNNMLGKFGALISHIFIHKWFGISSFLFPFLAFITGIRVLFGAKSFPLGKTFRFAAFSLVFFSVTLGYLFHDAFFYLGGTVGFESSQWLNMVLGKVGTGFLLGFIAISFLIVAFNISFNWFSREKIEEEITEEDEGSGELVNTLRENPENEIEEDIDPSEIEEPFIVPEEQKEPELELTAEQLPETNTVEFPVEPVIPADKPEIVALETPNEDDVQFTVERKEESAELSADEIEAKTEEVLKEFGEYDPTLDLSSYQFPSIDLLEAYSTGKETGVNTEELTANKNRIVETLNNYNIAIDKIKATIGPTVTLYEIIPAAGVRIAKIKNLEDDIALSLSALGIRIIAPIPGKGTIGIEVPNQHPEMVPMRALIASEKFQNTPMDLPVALGKTISNEIFIADLAKMPHLLMAGATGQGKSVGLNTILVSLLYKKHPSEIKFVLVDPKKVELTLFTRIERHFLAKLPDSAEAIITDTKKVVHTLNSLCIEMDQRYDLLKDAQVRNLREYNAKFRARKLSPEKGHRFLPYIVLVVDEFADLIMTAGKEVETPIARLAQLARAIGIHLIIATQRPSVNIITGTIKANFPSRIAFRVTSKIDSRTILDSGGAEQLIGRGDMLYSTGNDLIRLQCAFVDTPEVEKITEFIGNQRGYPSAFLLPEYVDENSDTKLEIDSGDRDSLFEDAARIVVNHQQGSASLLQRKLKLGYNRAGRIIDQLEAAGIIGPFEGSKAREVLIKDILSLDSILSGNKGEL
ncbi:MAG: DNA segregation ATPase FtsK/SpoIIIE, S-DNA-T family [Bacteroidetes bacterium]|nr:MAG: DNA segregation ATPase FtsK/SpoIIIE, S-DNA-T family [Bacteroidota bacterium]